LDQKIKAFADADAAGIMMAGCCADCDQQAKEG